MKSLLSGVPCWVVVVAFLVGCRSTKGVLDDYERKISHGSYAELAQEPVALAEKMNDTELLWRLLAGEGYSLNGKGTDALEQFDKAEDMMARNDQSSVFSQGADATMAMLANDKSFPYDGGGQDRVFTCLYKAIEYGVQGRQTAARAELNRASQHQENWLWQRKKDIASAREELERCASAQAKKDGTTETKNPDADEFLSDAAFVSKIRSVCGFDPAVDGDLEVLSAKDYMNTYVQHVCGVFRWLDGTGGRQYLRDAARLCPENETLKRDFSDVEANAPVVDQVWVYVEDGLCPAREEWRIDLPLLLIPHANKYVKYAGMALPYLRYRPAGANDWRISRDGTTTPMHELADFDRLLKVEYDVYMRGALVREITRTVLKVSSQVALGMTIDKTKDSNAKTILRISQCSAAAWALSTTAADLRCWTGLPKKAYVARVTRPADGRISLQADGQSIDFDVPPGNSMVFIRKPSPLSAPVIKVMPIKQS